MGGGGACTLPAPDGSDRSLSLLQCKAAHGFHAAAVLPRGWEAPDFALVDSLSRYVCVGNNRRRTLWHLLGFAPWILPIHVNFFGLVTSLAPNLLTSYVFGDDYSAHTGIWVEVSPVGLPTISNGAVCCPPQGFEGKS